MHVMRDYNRVLMMLLTYPDICELAQMPIVATIFREMREYRGGPQIGVYSFTIAPGNCVSRATMATVWPGTVIDMVGFEANDNWFGICK